MPNCAFLMVVAGGEANMAIHSLNAIVRSHPSASLLLLDDCTTDGTFEALAAWSSARESIHLLRNPYPFKYLGVTASVSRLLLEACKEDYDIVVKLDPDAYIYDRRLVEHCAELFVRNGPGVIGYTTHTPAGERREWKAHGRNLFIDSLPVHFRSGRTQLAAPFAGAFWKALIRGYSPGLCAVSLYALHGSTVRALARYWRCLAEPYDAKMRAEEVAVAVGVASIGHKLIRFNEPNEEAFAWIRFRPPLLISDEDLMGGRYAALHPLKGEEGWRIRGLIDKASSHHPGRERETKYTSQGNEARSEPTANRVPRNSECHRLTERN